MEMIIVIFFFSICAAICVSIFADARVTAEESVQLNNAVVRASNLAELYKSTDGDLTESARLLQDLNLDDVADITVNVKAVSITDADSSAQTGDHITVNVTYSDNMQAVVKDTASGFCSITIKAETLSEKGQFAEIYNINVRGGDVS
ncbi:MAG: hypothetical protein IKV96_02480 [Firmicutes bacterium]|nr:hypothetical protein [Bacillota bacterium]